MTAVTATGRLCRAVAAAATTAIRGPRGIRDILATYTQHVRHRVAPVAEGVVPRVATTATTTAIHLTISCGMCSSDRKRRKWAAHFY